MTAIFICGTDTGVGKTTATKLLLKYLTAKGFNAAAQKWVETGVPKNSKTKKYLPYTNPYRFAFPSSPHLSARLENKKVYVDKIIKSFNMLDKNFDFVIVEGTGGLLVPLNEKVLIVDIVQKLNLPVLIVAENKLGGINHTLLTIEALRTRKINILGLILNTINIDEDKIILKDNPKIINKISKVNILGVLPFTKDVKCLSDLFKSIGDAILNRSTRKRDKIFHEADFSV